MAKDNSNSTMEMGTSDQVLVATKRKKTVSYVIGGVLMVALIAIIVTLVVVLTGNGDDAVAEPTGSTTEGPTSPVDPTPSPSPTDPTEEEEDSTTTSTSTSTDTDTTPTTPEPPEEPLPPQLDLEAIIDGDFSAPSFNATWSSGSEILFRDEFGYLVLYDVDTDTRRRLIANTSEILQNSGRVTSLSPDGNHVVLAYNVLAEYRYSFLARYSIVNIQTNEPVHVLPPGVTDPEQAFLQNFVWGPSGTAFAFVYLNNIFYQAGLTTPPVAVTTDGVLNTIYNGIPDWVYEEEVFGSNNAIWFSNDGSRIAYARFDDTNVGIMKVPHYGIPGSVDYQYTQHDQIHYPKTGTTNPSVSVRLYTIGATPTVNIYNPPGDLTEPILKTVRFVNNNAIALMWTNRVQTQMRVVICNAGANTCNQIYSYTETEGWIDNIPLMFNEAGTSFITILPQAVGMATFKQIVQVSQGTGADTTWTAINRVNTAYTVLEILHWSSSDIIWYKATTVRDSSEQHIYSVDADRNVECFTCNIRTQNNAACLYNEGSISTDGERIVVNCAGPNVPEMFIYSTNGSLIRLWDSSDKLNENLENIALPEIIRFLVPLGGVAQPADVHIQVPPDYASRTNVPMLVYVYGGPDTALVTRQFNIDWGTSLVNRWNISVAHIDGRGSGLRGISNMFALNRRLGTVEIEDQINVTRYLQENFSWIDANRTCIWGWSYGGYAATKALAEGGDVFRCAAAVAPVVDWRFYDTIYTERYMDLPSANPEGYRASSLLTENIVEALRNKSYFLIHGTADDNVHYQHAMLLSRLLQRNDVYFSQMSYTDEDHGLIGVRPHLYHALEKFLKEYML